MSNVLVISPHPDDESIGCGGTLRKRVAARLVRRAVSGLAPDFSKPEVLMFEVWTPLQRMDQIVDITPFIETKIAAIRAHKSQCDVLGFDDAFLGLARYRGEMFSWPE